MKFVVLTVVFIVSTLALDNCHGQLTTVRPLTCDQLPKVRIPSLRTLIAYSPLDHVYASSAIFECTLEVYTHPISTAYTGTSLNIKGTVVTAYDYTVGPDGRSLELTDCNTGVKSTWYSNAAVFTRAEVYFCLYICNGTALGEMGCVSDVSNNRGVPPGLEAAVAQAKRVPTGERLHNATANCPGRLNRRCNLF